MNRLGAEASPYLRQHRENPVDWYAWGPEAFAAARERNVPILLSIGYSSCHWCHVMARESFEDAEVATAMNASFVNIKVDREERPDVDHIYMNAVQILTGRGGWPMTVFLTPDQQPFFAGTYFPPDDRQGRPGFLSVLRQIHKLWESRRDELTGSAEDMHQRIERALGSARVADDALLTPEVVRQAGALFKEQYDPRHGGFGGAPRSSAIAWTTSRTW